MKEKKFQEAAMIGELIEIRGKKLYVETFGEKELPAVLYLHGGPGEGSHDFYYHQAKRLGEHVRLIIIDQRGVCRSEGIEEGEEFGLRDLVEDCEALRDYFGIERWSVIGHSFGGFLALLYASSYPGSIEKIIFEGPTFDFELTSRSLIRKTSCLLEKYGQRDLAEQGRELAEADVSIRELTEGYMELSDHLGERRMEIYRHNHDNPTDYESYHSEEEWDEFYDRSDFHFDLLREEGEVFRSLLPLLSTVPNPMLLALGKYDATTCEKQIKAFQHDAPNGEVTIFEHSGHTPHYEEPDAFKEEVLRFIKEKTA
ncbi:alpha/beta hydrolase [Rossellomorea marisflavi]